MYSINLSSTNDENISREEFKVIAQNHFQQKQYSSLLMFCTKHFGNPELSDLAYFHLGYYFYSIEDHYNAIIHLDKAVKKNKKYQEAYCFRGLYYKHIVKDYDRSMINFKKSYKIKKNSQISQRCTLEMGLYYMEGRNYDKSLKWLSKAVKKITYSEFPWTTYFMRGMVFKKKGDFVKAIDDFKAAADIDCNKSRAFYEIGICYYQLNEYNLALQSFSTPSIETTIDLYLYKGMCFEKMNNYADALSEYTKALELDEEHAFALTRKGFCELKGKQGNYLASAYCDFFDLVRVDPDNPKGYYGLACVYYEDEKYVDALIECNSALDVDSKFYDAEYLRNYCRNIFINKGINSVTTERMKERFEKIDGYEIILKNPDKELD